MYSLIKVAVLANVFEFYELCVYGYLSSTLSQIFFKSQDATVALTQTFLIFAIGYLARPLGGLVLGTLSDYIGRGTTLKISLGLMAIATTGIGLLPTYQDIGFLATLGLLFFRILQGFSAGGELTGSGCYIFESSTGSSRSLLCSIVGGSSALGLLLASAVIFLLNSFFDPESIIQWAWRIPFLLSLPLAMMLFGIRNTLANDTLEHLKINDSKSNTLSLSQFGEPLLLGAAMVAFTEISLYPFLVWMPTYLSHFLGVPKNISQLTNTIALIILPIMHLVAGYVSSRFGYRKLILGNILFFLCLAYPLFKLLVITQGSIAMILSLQIFAAIIAGNMGGVLMELLGDLFPTQLRGRGMNLAHAVPNVLVGGTAPMVCNYMVNKGFMMFPIFYAMGFATLALIAALRLRQYSINAATHVYPS